MKTILALIIVSFLGACCYPAPKATTSMVSVEESMASISDTLQKTSDAVDILSDNTLSVEERVRLYHKRMEEINNKALIWVCNRKLNV